MYTMTFAIQLSTVSIRHWKLAGEAKKAHGAGYPLKLAQARECEGCVGPGPRVQNHLPESSSEVNGTEDCTSRPANFAFALTHVFHGVLVSVGLIVEGPEVLQS